MNLRPTATGPSSATNNQFTLDNLNRLVALDLKGTANDFTNGSGIWTIGAIGGGGTLTTITGGSSNFNIAALAAAT